jgi:mono/diheme cytochrome c family protein
MKLVRRILVTLLGILAIVVAGFAAWVASRQDLRFDAPTPALTASTDSAVIARGRYIVRDVAACASCHGAPEAVLATAEGEETPLSGGASFVIPPGTFRVPNITPDPETGIGRLSDGQIARALRHGVRHDGAALLPFMEMQGLADEDLVAVISYLRSMPPVRNEVPDHEWTLLGRIVRATVLANPVGPSAPPPAASPRGATVENGRYLAHAVATCQSCHTTRDKATGKFTNAEFSGTNEFESLLGSDQTWAPPNLTPDPKTGMSARMDEDAWVTRFRGGRILPGSPMPWPGYARMDEDDLRAIHKYLRTLPPVEHDTGPAVRPLEK